jgi:hypothetical protein
VDDEILGTRSSFWGQDTVAAKGKYIFHFPCTLGTEAAGMLGPSFRPCSDMATLIEELHEALLAHFVSVLKSEFGWEFLLRVQDWLKLGYERCVWCRGKQESR